MTSKISGKTGLTAGGGVVLAPIIIWVAQLLGVEIPPSVAAALAGLIATIIAWLVPATSGKWVITDRLGEDQDPQDALEFWEEDPTPSPDDVDAGDRVIA